MALVISLKVRAKLALPSHNVTEEEIEQCFANRDGRSCYDMRPEHQAALPTQWFVAQTDYGRRLKIVYVHDTHNNNIEIKSAYIATDDVNRIYNKYSQ